MSGGYLAAFWRRWMNLPGCVRRGDACFTGVTIGRCMLGFWWWPAGRFPHGKPVSQRVAVPPLDGGP